jgi:DNA phosphorothioation-dependent restriction protein DptG
MDKKIEETLRSINSYATIEDWLSLKKEILKEIPSDKRSLFSTRDPKTKKQSINAFEVEVIALWKEISGTDLYLDRR